MVRVFSFYDDAYCGAHFLEKQRQLHASRCRSHREENLRWLDAVPCSGRVPWWSMPPPGVCLLKWTTFRTRIPKVGHDATCSEAQVLVATADRVINPEIAHCHRTPERTYNWKVFFSRGHCIQNPCSTFCFQEGYLGTWLLPRWAFALANVYHDQHFWIADQDHFIRLLLLFLYTFVCAPNNAIDFVRNDHPKLASSKQNSLQFDEAMMVETELVVHAFNLFSHRFNTCLEK